MAVWTLLVGSGSPAFAGEVCIQEQSTCFDTITLALAAANPGETLKIEEGVYEESIVVGLAGLTLVGEEDEDVVIRPVGLLNPGILVTAAEVTLDNLIVRGPHENDGIRIAQLADDVTIKNVTVTDMGGDFANECIDTDANSTTIENSYLEACGRECINASGHGLTVEETRMASCGSDGIAVLGDYATIEESRIARTGLSCMFIVGNDATVVDNDLKTCGVLDVVGGINAGCGIQVFGNQAKVDRNRTRATLADGICGVGDEVTISRNRSVRTLASGIFWEGADDGTIEKNEIDDSGFHGMQLLGGPFTVASNEVEDSGAQPANDCFSGEVEASTFLGNEAEECPDDGFDIRGAGNDFFENESEDNIGNGFEVDGVGTFVDNEGDDNGRFDLCDLSNTIDPDLNDFKTTATTGCAD